MDETDDLHVFIARSSLAVILIFLACISIAKILKSFRVDRYFPASTTSIAIGFAAGAILNYTSLQEQHAFTFSPSLFFFLLLPPIMVDAGWSCRRKDFFKNLTAICLYAFAGTFITCASFGGILYAISLTGILPLQSALECFMFGAVIASTDPVAILSLLSLPDINVPPMLHSFIFGESILNDVISIVLFNTFKSLIPTECIVEEQQPMQGDCLIETIDVVTVMWAFGYFLLITLGSLALGLVIALAASFATKRINFKNDLITEVLVIILLPWGGYFCAESIKLSGIMAIFFTSVGMAHYSYYNISENARVIAHGFIQSLSHAADTFVFAYIGIRVGLSIQGEPLSWNIALIFISLSLVFLARAFNIFPLTFVANIFRKPNTKITFKMQTTLWWAGLRGAFALAVSLGYPIYYDGSRFVNVRDYVVTSTVVIVLTTTLVCGSTILPLLNILGINRPQSESLDPSSSFGYGSHDDVSTPKDPETSFRDHNREYGVVVRKWRRFDRTFMRRWFGGNPESSLLIEDHNDSSSLLRAASHHKSNHHLADIDISLSRSDTDGNFGSSDNSSEIH